MKVQDIMTRDPRWIAPEAGLDDALTLMDGHGIRHLPVQRYGKLVGILSDRDLLAATGWLSANGRARIHPEERLHPPTKVAEIMHERVASIGPEDTLLMACVEFLVSRIGCLPVLSKGELIGIVTEMDLLRAYSVQCANGTLPPPLDPPVSERMSTSPLTAPPTASFEDAARLFHANGIRHLPIVDGELLVGILSDRDLRRAGGRARNEGTQLEELMTRQPVTIEPDAPLSRAAERLLSRKISALPVVEEGNLIGILSLSDVLDQWLEAPVEGWSAERAAQQRGSS